MDVQSFLQIAELLSGTPVKDVTEKDRECLNQILVDDEREIRSSQFNELLLLVNKDRVSEAFFEYFFSRNCRVGELKKGVEEFQKSAMLCYGNFIYAYRRLSRIESLNELRSELAEYREPPIQCVTRFHERSSKLLDISLVAKSDTPLVGYLSATEIVAELGRATLLRDQWSEPTDWEPYEASVLNVAQEAEHASLLTLIKKFRSRFPHHGTDKFAEFLDQSIAQLKTREQTLNEVRDVATQNQDVYLTWDHMDVYFATSMRKRWEYEDLFDFIQSVMASDEIADLNLRYFDPTQAFTKNRVNKGLVEALMLKRAKCTVYSVQDTDTLGKDSELAATLAQGKTVIAYVPSIDVDERKKVLANEDPAAIHERLRFVLYADDQFAKELSEDDLQFVRNFPELEEFEENRFWRSIGDDDRIRQFRNVHSESLDRLCRIIAESERRIYDRRARTLAQSHPLAIQVNLDTGVSNGVLVVRTISACARLLRMVLTKSMEFDLVFQPKEEMWYLNEKISGCPFRVVTRDRKLTNCFWNFYRAPSP